MAFKRECFTQTDIERYHPHCAQCSKKIVANISVVTCSFMHHRQSAEVNIHEKCFMKFAATVADDPHDSTPSIQVKLTEETVSASKQAMRELASV